MNREQRLESALYAAMAALKTYGNHPIVEQQALKALNGGTGTRQLLSEGDFRDDDRESQGEYFGNK